MSYSPAGGRCKSSPSLEAHERYTAYTHSAPRGVGHLWPSRGSARCRSSKGKFSAAEPLSHTHTRSCAGRKGTWILKVSGHAAHFSYAFRHTTLCPPVFCPPKAVCKQIVHTTLSLDVVDNCSEKHVVNRLLSLLPAPSSVCLARVILVVG